jgi:hypothetical protein
MSDTKGRGWIYEKHGGIDIARDLSDLRSSADLAELTKKLLEINNEKDIPVVGRLDLGNGSYILIPDPLDAQKCWVCRKIKDEGRCECAYMHCLCCGRYKHKLCDSIAKHKHSENLYANLIAKTKRIFATVRYRDDVAFAHMGDTVWGSAFIQLSSDPRRDAGAFWVFKYSREISDGRLVRYGGRDDSNRTLAAIVHSDCILNAYRYGRHISRRDGRDLRFSQNSVYANVVIYRETLVDTYFQEVMAQAGLNRPRRNINLCAREYYYLRMQAEILRLLVFMPSVLVDMIMGYSFC